MEIDLPVANRYGLAKRSCMRRGVSRSPCRACPGLLVMPRPADVDTCLLGPQSCCEKTWPAPSLEVVPMRLSRTAVSTLRRVCPINLHLIPSSVPLVPIIPLGVAPPPAAIFVVTCLAVFHLRIVVLLQ